jgi:group I intron endonuclease
MQNRMPCVYALFCKVTGLAYIGSTVTLSTRLPTHLKRLREGWHHSKKLQRAWKKYGEDSFVLTILEFCSKEHLLEREQFYIDVWHAYKKGYNCVPIAGATRGYVQSKETRRKKSLAMLGRKQTPMHVQRRAQSMLGKNKGKATWNKGKTKDTDPRVAAIGKWVSKNLSGKTFEELYGKEKAAIKCQQHREVLLGRKRIYSPDGTWTLEPQKPLVFRSFP